MISGRKISIVFAPVILIAMLFYSCQSDEQINFERYYSSGSLVFQAHCQNCHGAHGEGLAGLIPPLSDSVYLKNNRKYLACYVHNGASGTITVLNKSFDGNMPPNDLTPVEVAEVLTYLTNSFGNKLGIMSLKKVNDELAACH